MADEQISTTSAVETSQIEEVISQVQALIVQLTDAYATGYVGTGDDKQTVKVKYANQSDNLYSEFTHNAELISARYTAADIFSNIESINETIGSKEEALNNRIDSVKTLIEGLMGDKDQTGIKDVIDTFQEVKNALSGFKSEEGFDVFGLLNALKKADETLKDDLGKKYDKITNEYKAADTSLKEDFDAQLAKLTTDLKNNGDEDKRAIDALNLALTNAQTSHDQEVSNLKTAQVEEIKLLKAAQLKEVTELKEAHAADVADLRKITGDTVKVTAAVTDFKKFSVASIFSKKIN